MSIRELILRRNERNDGGLERKVLELNLAKTGRGRRVNHGASRLGRHGDLQGQIANGQAHERARIHLRCPSMLAQSLFSLITKKLLNLLALILIKPRLEKNALEFVQRETINSATLHRGSGARHRHNSLLLHLLSSLG